MEWLAGPKKKGPFLLSMEEKKKGEKAKENSFLFGQIVSLLRVTHWVRNGGILYPRQWKIPLSSFSGCQEYKGPWGYFSMSNCLEQKIRKSSISSFSLCFNPFSLCICSDDRVLESCICFLSFSFCLECEVFALPKRSISANWKSNGKNKATIKHFRC